MYTKQQFGEELKELIISRKPIAKIGCWSHAMYYQHLFELDSNWGELMLTLGTMEMGPEFERSYEQLNEIADRLIAGEDVIL